MLKSGRNRDRQTGLPRAFLAPSPHTLAFRNKNRVVENPDTLHKSCSILVPFK